MLDRVVREEAAEHMILAGDEVIIPYCADMKSGKKLWRLSVSTTSNTDAEKVRLLLDDYCAGSGSQPPEPT